MSVNTIEPQRFGVKQETANIFDKASPAGLSDDQLTERVVGHASQIAALTAQFLDLLVEFDHRKVWIGDGIRSCAHWLSWRTGLSLRAAQDHLRIAHALTDLPQLHTAFADGKLSYSKVRALTRVATPEREEELLHVALSATAAQVELLVRTITHIDHSDNDTTGPIDSHARWRWNDDGTLSVTMRLRPIDGARFLAGIVRSEYERTRTSIDPDLPTDGPRISGTPDTPPAKPDLWRHVPANIADAVIAMADAAATMVNMPEYAPGAEIVIHTESNNTEPHLDSGPAVSDTDVDEAACGGSTRTVEHHPRRDRLGTRGVTMAWGRKRRLPTTSVLRALFERDRGCRHPGCGRTRHLHAHHVTFWRHGGTTDPDNLILLCSTHHRALHNNEYSITAHGHQHFTFHRTDGALIETAPTTTTPHSWHPDTTIANDAVTPTNGGRLDLGYTTEVLYAAWQLRTPPHHQAHAA